jgi:pimeloyl-ACP methyl ester carboxylesterase
MSNANMVPGKRSKGAGCLRWLGRVALGGVILLLGLAVIGANYQGIASARDAKLYKPVDQMVDVNGIQMRLDCRGSGSPTVVLEAGAGGSSSSWIRIQNDVAGFTRVCSYDRAGYGWSDAVHEELSPQKVAEMLHTLLEKGGENPPYLMVGHSFGGVYIRVFTEKYPDEVVGMVLVDSSHENQNQQIPPEIAESPEAAMLETVQSANLRFCQIAAPIGLIRALNLMDASVSLMFTEAEKGPALAESYRSGLCSAVLREAETTTTYSGQPGNLGDMPLIVLSQKMDAQKLYDGFPPVSEPQLTLEMMQPMVDSYNENQDELTALSTRGKRIIVEETGHNIQLDQPQVVIDAIREVSEQIAR